MKMNVGASADHEYYAIHYNPAASNWKVRETARTVQFQNIKRALAPS